ncbi:MAG TPA: DUF1376 domain-containing protein [Salinimicrobium sp.]|nr:DUF1376 domain-containing protein [Salinimicrobium sp.]
MAKDPAALVYIDKWVAATNGMKAEFRAWYFDLMLYQFDKGPIPNDMDELAGVCRVRPSEYNLFNQMVDQVLKQKFKQNEEGKWVNSFADEVITKRKSFKDKRVKSSNIGVVVKMAMKIDGVNEKVIKHLKNELYDLSTEEIETYKNKNMLNQKVNQVVNLYINEDVIEDVDSNILKGGVGEKTAYEVLEKQSPAWLEQFEMNSKNQISDWDTFKTNFEFAVAKDKISFAEISLLQKRLQKQFANWDKTPKKNKKPVINQR